MAKMHARKDDSAAASFQPSAFSYQPGLASADQLELALGRHPPGVRRESRETKADG
jgi:hypothetical protein